MALKAAALHHLLDRLEYFISIEIGRDPILNRQDEKLARAIIEDCCKNLSGDFAANKADYLIKPLEEIKEKLLEKPLDFLKEFIKDIILEKPVPKYGALIFDIYLRELCLRYRFDKKLLIIVDGRELPLRAALMKVISKLKKGEKVWIKIGDINIIANRTEELIKELEKYL